MQVAILTKEYPPEVYGGAGVHVSELTAELSKLVDLQLHCFGAKRQDALVKKNYESWDALRDSGPISIVLDAMARDLAMLADLQDVDICHSHTWYTNFAGYLAQTAYGAKHVITSHSLEPLRPWKREQLGPGYELSLWIEKTSLRAAERIIAVSEAMKQDILSCYPEVLPDSVEVIYNGVDTKKWKPRSWSGSLERFKIDPEKQLVVFLGRITRQKGLSYLLKAAPLISDSAQLVICAGHPDTEEIREEVHSLLRTASQRSGGLVLIEQVLPTEELSELFTRAACLVCPSIYEPFGLVNVEAMACGAPVVASAVGGIKEIVEDGVTGYLVPVDLEDAPPFEPRDGENFAAGIAAAVNALLSNPDLLRAMRVEAKKVAETKFSWHKIAQQTMDLYTNIMQGSA
ncbi:MAG: glycogen synthase [Firmicutes bacterium]|nr:glycogen synthase [Bacillota bacterium]